MPRCTLAVSRLVRLSLAFVALIVLPLVAYAHGVLKSSEPAKGEHLSAAPRELRLTFNEPVEVAVAGLQLVAPDSSLVMLSPLRHGGDSAQVIVADVVSPLVAGTYTVRWRVTGRDGHPVRGSFSFTIAPGASGLAASGAASPTATTADAHSAGHGPGGTTAAPADSAGPHHSPVSLPQGEGFGAESPLFAVVRALTYLGILGVLGAVIFRLFVLSRVARVARVGGNAGGAEQLVASASSPVAAFAMTMAAGLLVAAALRLYAQSYAMHGPGDALNAALVSSMVIKTVWGWGWLLQVAATLVVLGAVWRARRTSPTGWTVAALAALVLAVTPALSGHAVSTPGLAWLAVPNDTLHVIGAGGWLGTLLTLVVVGLPVAMRLDAGLRGRAVADLVNAFSPLALTFAGMVVVTGAVSAWLHLGSLSALWGSEYGRVLTLKLIALVPVLALGAYNWRRVRPTLGADTASRRITRSAAAELAVGAIVLAVTAVLVATPVEGGR
ncbi:MAG: copper resistance CopC/CopD family protein [Gemmatimonadaceae bacterium]